MAVLDIATLKSCFETGDIPKGQDFTNLIDSLHDVIPTNVVQTDTNGNIVVTGNILPNSNSTVDLGSPTQRFKTIYVDEAKLATNTLYIGDTPVLGTSMQTIELKADPDQSIAVKTSGLGATNIQSSKNVNITTNGSDADILISALGIGSQTRISSGTEILLTAPTTTISGAGTVTGDFTVSGNFHVTGTTTTVDSTTLQVADNIVVVNKGEAGTGVTKGLAGIQVDRGDSADYQFVFDESIDMFRVGMVGNLETLASQNYVQAQISTKADTAALSAKADISSLSAYAPLASPTFTGTVVGITKGMVGLGNVDNTSDSNKPVSVAQQNAINTAIATVTKSTLGLGNVDNTSDASKPVSSAQQTALDLKAPLASPTFTGTVSGISKSMVGLSNVDNTSDTSKPISTATQTALNLKADASAITNFVTSSYVDGRITSLINAAPAALDTLGEIATQLASDESAASALTTTVSLKAPINNPTFTGTVSGITATMVGLGNVNNTADSAKVVASAAKLTTARNVAGVSFDGSADIAIPFANLTSKPTTVSGYGITDAAALGTATPIVAGTASAGSGTTASKVDHVHPLQTSLPSGATLASPVITNYTETCYTPSAAASFTVALSNGTLQKLPTNANCTITLPTSVAGSSYTIIVAYGGAHTLTWAGGSTIKWAGGTAPTATSVSGKSDIFVFMCDGTNTYGASGGSNY